MRISSMSGNSFSGLHGGFLPSAGRDHSRRGERHGCNWAVLSNYPCNCSTFRQVHYNHLHCELFLSEYRQHEGKALSSWAHGCFYFIPGEWARSASRTFNQLIKRLVCLGNLLGSLGIRMSYSRCFSFYPSLFGVLLPCTILCSGFPS